jgi:hypothetical protein
MPSFPVISSAVWTPVIWGMLVVTGVVGAVALLSPRIFAKLSAQTSRWVDSKKVLECLDKRIDIDQYVLPFSRWLGAAVVASVTALALVIWKYG